METEHACRAVFHPRLSGAKAPAPAGVFLIARGNAPFPSKTVPEGQGDPGRSRGDQTSRYLAHFSDHKFLKRGVRSSTRTGLSVEGEAILRAATAVLAVRLRKHGV